LFIIVKVSIAKHFLGQVIINFEIYII